MVTYRPPIYAIVDLSDAVSWSWDFIWLLGVSFRAAEGTQPVAVFQEARPVGRHGVRMAPTPTKALLGGEAVIYLPCKLSSVIESPENAVRE